MYRNGLAVSEHFVPGHDFAAIRSDARPAWLALVQTLGVAKFVVSLVKPLVAFRSSRTHCLLTSGLFQRVLALSPSLWSNPVTLQV